MWDDENSAAKLRKIFLASHGASKCACFRTRNLALALMQALQMWSNERYRPFLLRAKPGKLTEEWFRWFVGAWNVARTIKDGRQEFVRLQSAGRKTV